MKEKHSKRGHAKKKKKDKKRSKAKESSSESQESEGEPMWVEKNDNPNNATSSKELPDENNVNTSERDNWMVLSESLFPVVSRNDLRSKRNQEKKEEKEAKAALEKPGQHSRELNPYWKEGGTGLPEEAALSRATEPSLVSSNVGDGGLSWLRRAYERCQEQARLEKRSLKDVAAERWGSLEKLESLLKEAEDKPKLQSSGSGNVCSERYWRNEHDRSSSSKYGRHKDETSSHRSSGRNEHTMRMMKPRYDSDEEESQDSRHRQEKHSSSRSRDNYDHQSGGHSSSSRSTWRKKEFNSPDDTNTRNPEKVAAFPQDSEKPRVPTKVGNDLQPDKDHHTESGQEVEQKLEEQGKLEQKEEQGALTDEQMNALAAKLVKAEIMGNTMQAAKLKEQLEAARQARSVQGIPEAGTAGRRARQEVVVLTRTDERGMTRPLPTRETDGDHGRARKKAKVQTHDKAGERLRYFYDDDKYDIKKMFEREKLSTAEDQNSMMARLAGKGIEKTNEDYTLDDVLTGRAGRQVSEAQLEEMERTKAIAEHKKMSSALDSCTFCFDSPKMKKHLIVAVGKKTYLSVPSYMSLVDNHCLIIPMHHVRASTFLDEDVWSEIQMFRRGLTKMFGEQGQDVVFFETSMRFKSCPHMVLQCVPLPRDVGDMASIYFKKAIMESEGEWAENKKVVDLSRKDVRKSIPKGLPYFAVDFGLDGGFAHVIEEEKTFPNNFAEEIIGGMLDLDSQVWRKPQRQGFEEQRKKVLSFTEVWKPFDWTEPLKEDPE